MSKSYVYPRKAPLFSDKDAGWLGEYWSRGADFTTEYVDYIKFTAYKVKYNTDGKGSVLTSITDGNLAKDKVETLDTVFLYMPQNVNATYSASYNATKIGAIGVAATAMLGQSTGEQIAESIKAAAGDLTPEAAFNAVSEGVRAVSGLLGTEFGASGSDLLALSQGKVFNPYEEQIFQGVTFRNHNFQFKLIARSLKEAEEIKNILRVFKKNMLPNYDGSVVKQQSSKSGDGADKSSDTKPSIGQSIAENPFSSSQGNRYLTVPNRFKVEFVRMKYNSKTGEMLSDSNTAPIELFKIKDCIIDNLGVTYTPDGQYVSTLDGNVPALELSISLKEVALVTAKDVDNGY